MKQNLFDIHSAILSEAGEPNVVVPQHNINKLQYQEKTNPSDESDSSQQEGMIQLRNDTKIFSIIFFI